MALTEFDKATVSIWISPNDIIESFKIIKFVEEHYRAGSGYEKKDSLLKRVHLDS